MKNPKFPQPVQSPQPPTSTRFGFGSKPAASFRKMDHSGTTGKIVSILPDGSIIVTILTEVPLNNGQTVEVCKTVGGNMVSVGVGMVYIRAPQQYSLIPNTNGFTNPEVGDTIRICSDDSEDQNLDTASRMLNLLHSSRG